MGAIGVVLLAGLAVGCSSESDTAATTTTADGQLPSDAPCHDFPEGCTPRPTSAQSAVLERRIGAIYPGMPDGKATDWSVSSCMDMRSGEGAEYVLRNVRLRFAGGTRPDPTPDQAEQIVGVILDVGFCDGSTIERAPATTAVLTTTSTSTTLTPSTTLPRRTTEPPPELSSNPPAGLNLPNCSDYAAAGYGDIPSSSPVYRTDLDPDFDGTACEQDPRVNLPGA